MKKLSTKTFTGALHSGYYNDIQTNDKVSKKKTDAFQKNIELIKRY